MSQGEKLKGKLANVQANINKMHRVIPHYGV